MTFKTIEEQEREAYVTGHTGMAKLLAEVIAGHEAEVLFEDREHELQTEIDDLKAAIKLLEDEARQDKREIGALNYILDGLVDRGIEW
jgi:hypothetical protein